MRGREGRDGDGDERTRGREDEREGTGTRVGGCGDWFARGRRRFVSLSEFVMVEVFIAEGEVIEVVDAARDYKLCLAGSDDPMNQEGCSTCVGVAGTDLDRSEDVQGVYGG